MMINEAGISVPDVTGPKATTMLFVSMLFMMKFTPKHPR